MATFQEIGESIDNAIDYVRDAINDIPSVANGKTTDQQHELVSIDEELGQAQALLEKALKRAEEQF